VVQLLQRFGPCENGRYGKDAIGLPVRRTRAELVETIERLPGIYGPLGWKLNETENRAAHSVACRRAERALHGTPVASVSLFIGKSLLYTHL
jgi:hypothetical protein